MGGLGLMAVCLIPPFLLSLYAQWKVKSAFSQMAQVPARMTGAQAARQMLDSEGLSSVRIERVGGRLSDHYDPRAKVIRLSGEVHDGRSMAALGVACHEAGHAFQDAKQYAPLMIRNAAVPMANFGSGISGLLLMGGMLMSFSPLIWLGVIAFGAVVFFQIVNLPVEFDASARAKAHLVDHRLISEMEAPYISKVLNAAALTYVAATLQSVMTLVYYLMILLGGRSND